MRPGQLDDLADSLRRDIPAWATPAAVRAHVERAGACLAPPVRAMLAERILEAGGRCPWCGAYDAEPGTTCPRSIDCPSCHAGAGHPCRRPSGHRAAELHAGRIRIAEELDDARQVPAGQLAIGDEPEPFEGGDGSEPGQAGGYELLEDPADHEVDCECSGCTDTWRPEDAAPALLEAERWAAAEKLTIDDIADALAGPDPVRAAAADDPRGERDR